MTVNPVPVPFLPNLHVDEVVEFQPVREFVAPTRYGDTPAVLAWVREPGTDAQGTLSVVYALGLRAALVPFTGTGEWVRGRVEYALDMRLCRLVPA